MLPKFTLQWAIVISFLLQIFLIVGLVGYLSFQSGRTAVENLAIDLIHGNNRVITEHLTSYLSIPKNLSRINADAIHRGILDVSDHDLTRQYLWDQMQLYDLTYIGVGMVDGSGLGIGRFDGETIIMEDWTGARKDNITHYKADDRGHLAEALYTWTFHNDEETWYTNPIRAGQPIWSIVATNLVTGPYVAASASRPIYNPQDELLGMLSADIHLLKLGRFLDDLEISQTGLTFVVEQDGTLIGNSGKASPFVLENDKIRRLKASQVMDPFIQTISSRVQEDYAGFEKVYQEENFTVILGSDRYFVNIQPWKNDLGLPWLVGTVLPEDEFLAQIKANAQRTILLCGLALVIATATGLFTARWIASPIEKINQASTAIAKGDLDQTVPPSSILELDSLTGSFNEMADRLQKSFIALEESNDKLEERVGERTAALETALQKLGATQAQIIQSEKMSSLGQLVAGVAHEINNPVSFIHGNLDYAESYLKDLVGLIKLYEENYPQPVAAIVDEQDAIDWAFMQSDIPRLLTSMQTGTERIREIVLSLRNFSRTDEAELKTVDIHEGLDSTIMILKHRLKDQGDRPEIKLMKEYGTLPKVECYPGPLNQVFMNILSNAIDALEETPTPLGCITVRTRCVDSNWIQIAIADNGPGIPEAIQNRIFEPFFTTKDIGKGTGMGLSISHQIITERHQGQFFCTSKIGEGTEFLMAIPMMRADMGNSLNTTLDSMQSDPM